MQTADHGVTAGDGIAAVVFDIGETLVDETRVWQTWADWMGTPALTFFSVIGAVIARGEPHPRVFEILDPGFDWRAELRRRATTGEAEEIVARQGDLYADAIPTLERLTALGIRVGVAGNQPAAVAGWLNALQPTLELVGISDIWGLTKPDPRFFERIASELDLPAQRIAYVGDRIDNDVIPAIAAGMRPVLIRRGPWGHIQIDPACPDGTVTIRSLDQLPSVLFGAS